MPRFVPATAAQAAPTFAMHPTALVINRPPTYEEWQEYGVNILRIGNAAQWALGDWLLYGESRADWSEMWTQALETTQKSEDAMQTAMNVCRKFPPERRRMDLSFGHHREVAALDADDQDRLLERAATEGWTTRMLREHVREARGLPAPSPRLSTANATTETAPGMPAVADDPVIAVDFYRHTRNRANWLIRFRRQHDHLPAARHHRLVGTEHFRLSEAHIIGIINTTNHPPEYVIVDSDGAMHLAASEMSGEVARMDPEDA